MFRKTLNNKGVALVTVVLFFLVLVILLGGVMFSSISNQGNAKLSKDHTAAYYVAESGMNITIEKLKDYLESYDNIPIGMFDTYMDNLDTYLKTELSTDNLSLTMGTYDIDINGNIADKTYTLRSTGTVNDVSRIIEMQFKFIDKTEDMMKAIYVKGSITVNQPNTNIEGPIASLMETDYSVSPPIVATIDIYKACDVTEIYLPDTNSTVAQQCSPKIVPQAIPNPETIEFKEFEMDIPPTTLQSVSVSSGKLVLSNWDSNPSAGYVVSSFPGSLVEIDLGTSINSRIFKLVLTDSDSLKNTSIQVKGDGELMIFTTVNKTDTSKNGKIDYAYQLNGTFYPDKTDDLTQIQLILRKGTGFGTNNSGNPTLNMTNSSVYRGLVKADSFDVFYQGSNFKGFLATLGDSIIIKSNSDITGPMWIYAPNAIVDVSSGGYLQGAIISQSVVFSSGGDLKYGPYLGSPPSSIQLPLFDLGLPIKVGIEYSFVNFKEV